jgi:hypothetical protein
MMRLGPYTHYGWGWDIGLFGWWFVWSRCDGLHVYISSDATPPHREFNRGITLWRRYQRR